MQNGEERVSEFGSFTDLGSLWHRRPLGRNGSFDAIMKTVSSVGAIWSPHALDSGIKSIFSMDDLATVFRKTPTENFEDGLRASQSGKGLSGSSVSRVGLVLPANSKAPSFLPMFPWYSGTSADLLKTLFDLVVSLKVFVGRFDMRTMLAATNLDDRSSLNGSPHEGDGFIFEQLQDKTETWIDFCADTGDGGNSTYSIARCLAARRVDILVSKEIASSTGAEIGPHTLPRGDVLVHGGDLAYPNPTGRLKAFFLHFHSACDATVLHIHHIALLQMRLMSSVFSNLMTKHSHRRPMFTLGT